MSTPLEIEVGAGELCDRLSILGVKRRRLRDPAKRAAVGAELARLARSRARLGDEPRLPPLEVALGVVNDRLWSLEDRIRDHERRADFGAAFIDLARTIYRLNDLRHSLKCEIDALFGATRSEEKEYVCYEEPRAAGRELSRPQEDGSCRVSS